MILNPYDTIAMRGVNWKSAQKQVAEAAVACGVREGVFRLWDETSDRASSEHLRYYKGVDGFSQPIIFNVPSSKDPLVAVDYRNLKGESAYIKEVRDVYDSNACLTLHCAIEGTAQDLYHPVAQAAFANLLVGVVAQNFGIEPKLRAQLFVVAAAHYYNITHGINPAVGYGDAERMVLMRDIVANIRIPLDVVSATMDLLEVGSSVDTFVKNVKAVDGTDRVNRLNAGLITNGAKELWYGLNANQLMMVAFEHAPTFCGMLYAALGKGGYSRSDFARNLRYVTLISQKGDTFVKMVRALKAEYGDEYQ